MALDRRKVTMRSVQLNAVTGQILQYEATDHVAVEDIDLYVQIHREQGWQYIEVGEETDHGPGGEDGPYVAPSRGDA